MTIQLVSGEQKELNVALLPTAAFQTITDPRIELSRFGWGYGTLPEDFIAGAELSCDFHLWLKDLPLYPPGTETYVCELNLIQGSTAIPIGSSTTIRGGSTTVGYTETFIVTLPTPGTYATMVRIYRDGVLVAQYPYLSTIEVFATVPSYFSYAKPTISVYWNPDLPGYCVKTTCVVTNIGATSKTRKIAVWSLAEYYEQEVTECTYHEQLEQEWNCLRQYAGGIITLTLSPGQNKNLLYDGWSRASGSQSCCVQFRDDAGGRSPRSDKFLINF